MREPLRFAAVVVLSLVASLLAGGATALAAAGWGLSLVNGWVGWWIDRRLVGLRGGRATTLVLLGHAVRLMTLVLVLLLAAWMLKNNFRPFAFATLAGYFVFLFAEVVRLAGIR